MKRIAAVALCLSIAAAGFPAQARASCVMDKGTQERQAMSAAPQVAMACHKSTSNKPDKNCCCQDMACGAGNFTMNMPDDGGMAPRPDVRSRLAILDDSHPILNPTSTQERPPRRLALG